MPISRVARPTGRLLRGLVQRLPRQCALCGDPAEAGLPLCRACCEALPWNTRACETCAEPLEQPARFCARCLRRPPPFAASRVPLVYAEPVDSLITGLKFGGRLAYAGVLGELLARAPPGDTVSCVVPVPLHASRLRQRGFNQALELLRPLARAAGLRVDWRAVRRTRMTVAQSGLSAARRARNVTGAFAVTRRFDGERVAIFDDVVTTGATAGELARALRQAGAREVLLWACARAPSPRH